MSFLTQLVTRRRIRGILACAILVSLSLTLSPMLEARAIAPMQSQPPPNFDNWTAWQKYMAKLPTPQEGCFVATYPNAVWQLTQCGPASSQPHTVGAGNDWVAKAPSGKLIASSSSLMLATGLTSEKDVKSKNANVYSLQINSDLRFPVTFHGKSTTGWEQFIYDNQGAKTPVGPPYGQIEIEYWLISYTTAYGSCPPASQDPPGGGSGWINDGTGNCFFNTNGPQFTPDVPATKLYSLVFSATANLQRSSKDTVTLCITFGKCYTKSITDTVLNLYKQWTQSEFNVFGICCFTEAVFNSGTTITLGNFLEDQNGVSLGTAVCSKGGFTAETNNLNLGSCSTGSSPSNIIFSESN